MEILLLATGGTFDKEYNEITEKLVFKETHLSHMLKLGRCRLDINIRTVMLIDSLDMTEQDRQLILDTCRKAKEDRIVITHGTSNMEKTAKALGDAIKDKTIVLTGAMSPYAFGSSDGLFNLGCALAFVQSLPKGTYVAMNGRVLPSHNVTKNTKTGDFEARS